MSSAWICSVWRARSTRTTARSTRCPDTVRASPSRTRSSVRVPTPSREAPLRCFETSWGSGSLGCPEICARTPERRGRRYPVAEPLPGYAPTVEQEELRDSVRRFLVTTSPESVVRKLVDTPGGFDRANWKRLGSEIGAFGLAVPDDLRGA